MNYKIIYDNLIAKGKNRIKIDDYYEIHHIIPRCCGGSNEPDNLVKLTAKEHYVAHHLLMLMYKDTEHYRQLIYAFRYMTVGHYGKRLNNAYDYAYMRKLFSENHPTKDPKVREKISNSVKHYFETESADKKTARIQKMRETAEQRTDEQNRIIKDKLKQARSKWTDEQKNDYSEKLKCAQRDFWNSLSDEARAEHITKLQRGQTEESNVKRSNSLKQFLSNLTAEELTERQKNSFGSCDHKKRGEAISRGKKGKKTNQWTIMGNRFADMSIEEFEQYLQTKSHYVWKKYRKLREKVLNERNNVKNW